MVTTQIKKRHGSHFWWNLNPREVMLMFPSSTGAAMLLLRHITQTSKLYNSLHMKHLFRKDCFGHFVSLLAQWLVNVRTLSIGRFTLSRSPFSLCMMGCGHGRWWWMYSGLEQPRLGGRAQCEQGVALSLAFAPDLESGRNIFLCTQLFWATPFNFLKNSQSLGIALIWTAVQNIKRLSCSCKYSQNSIWVHKHYQQKHPFYDVFLCVLNLENCLWSQILYFTDPWNRAS